MSYGGQNQPNNPYQSSGQYRPQVAGPIGLPLGNPTLTQLDFGRAMGWMFRSPNWMSNLFWLVLCALLGTVVIGNIVAAGYQIEVIQRRSRGRDQDPVDFDSSRFVDYLTRGVWPFLVYLVSATVLGTATMVLIGIVSLCCVVPFSAAGGGEPPPVVGLIMIGLWMIIGMMAMVAAMFFMLPMCVRAGLASNFGEGFRIAWVRDFVGRMWPTLLYASLMTIVMALIAEIVGFALCFVGLFFTMAWFQLFMTDLGAQIYDIYLVRGGEPVPMAGEAIDAHII